MALHSAAPRLPSVSDNGPVQASRAKRQFRWSSAIVLLACLTTIRTLHSEPQNTSIDVSPGEKLVLRAQGEGDQVYGCVATSSTPKWVLEKPDARLIDSSGNTIGTHFAGPTWRMNDGSAVQGELVGSRPSLDADSVPWLLLHSKPNTATGSLATIEFIQRTKTHGGAAPASGCGTAQDIGKTVRVPYTATYSFYAHPSK